MLTRFEELSRIFNDGSILRVQWDRNAWFVYDKYGKHCGPYATEASAYEWVLEIVDDTG